MTLKYRPMAIMGFSSLSVLFLCTYFDDRFSIVSIGAGIIILLLTLAIGKLRERVTPFFIAAALILSGVSFEVLSDYKISYADSLTDNESVIEATVLDEPEFKNSRYYYTVKTEKIDGVNFEVKLRLSASQFIDTEPYDKIKLKVNLYEIGSFSRDIKLYFHSKGIFLGGYVSNYDGYPIEIIKPESKPLGYHLLQLRKTVEGRILDKLPNDCGAVTVGMLTGNKDYISTELLGNIRAAGVAPVFAVSGMHLSVWIMGLYEILELFGVRKRLNSAVGIAFTLFFMGLTGFSPSVCRAGIMLLVILVGNLFRRKADAINSLGFAALILGIINPMIVADIGFLLSFSSTFGIVALNPWLRKKLEPLLEGGFIKKLIKAAIKSVYVSFCATVASLGFIIVFIGYVSVYSIFSNLSITYVASLCMLCGGFTALLYPLGGAGNLFAVATGCFAKYIIKVVGDVTHWPFAMIDTSNVFWTYGVIAFYAIVAGSFIVFKNKKAFKASCVGLAMTIVFCTLLYHFEYSGYTYFRVLNVEDSVAVMISQDGKNALICSQSDNKYISSSLDDIKPDIIIADVENGCSSGILSLIKEYNPEKVIVSEADKSFKSVLTQDKITKAENAKIRLFDNTNAQFVSNSHYSVVFCNSQDVEFCILLRVDDIENIPEKYLSGDIFIGTELYKDSDFEKVLIAGETKVKGLISTEKYGNIDVKIKNDNYKIIVEEG